MSLSRALTDISNSAGESSKVNSKVAEEKSPSVAEENTPSSHADASRSKLNSITCMVAPLT